MITVDRAAPYARITVYDSEPFDYQTLIIVRVKDECSVGFTRGARTVYDAVARSIEALDSDLLT